jgi:hypothetical protein
MKSGRSDGRIEYRASSFMFDQPFKKNYGCLAESQEE